MIFVSCHQLMKLAFLIPRYPAVITSDFCPRKSRWVTVTLSVAKRIPAACILQSFKERETGEVRRQVTMLECQNTAVVAS